MFITKKKHEAAVERLNDKIATLNDDLRAEQNTVGHMIQRNRELQTQLLSARAEAEANKAELARWRQYGQMRDPATGRLIPRVKAEVA